MPAQRVGAAALWVSLQAATEISVTDVMQVRTFAEEVYTQIVGGPLLEEGVARAAAVAIPFVALAAAATGIMVHRWERQTAAAHRPARAALVIWSRSLALAFDRACECLGRTAVGGAVG